MDLSSWSAVPSGQYPAVSPTVCRCRDRKSRIPDRYKAIQQAYYQALGADERRQAAAASEIATREAFDAMSQKYELGRANATEYEQSRSEYVRACSEAVRAKYESILRRRILAFYNK